MARWISISSRRWTISIRQWRLAVMARGAGSNRSCARRRFTAQSLSRSTTTSSLTHNKLCRPRSAWHGTAQHISGIYPARGLSPARSSASKRSPTQRRAWINSLPYHHRKRLPSRHRGRHPRLPSCQLGGHQRPSSRQQRRRLSTRRQKWRLPSTAAGRLSTRRQKWRLPSRHRGRHPRLPSCQLSSRQQRRRLPTRRQEWCLPSTAEYRASTRLTTAVVSGLSTAEGANLTSLPGRAVPVNMVLNRLDHGDWTFFMIAPHLNPALVPFSARLMRQILAARRLQSHVRGALQHLQTIKNRPAALPVRQTAGPPVACSLESPLTVSLTEANFQATSLYRDIAWGGSHGSSQGRHHSPNMGGHGMSLIVESSLAISCQINWWGLESPCVDAFGTGLSSSYSTGARIESQFIFMWWYNRRANGDQRVHNRFSWAYNGLVKTKLSPHEWVSAARTAVALVGA